MGFRFASGMLLTQSLLLSFVAVGWCHRLMRRVTYLQWWKLRETTVQESSFAVWASSIDGLKDLSSPPNLLISEKINGRRAVPGWRGLLSAFLINARLGVQAVFNTWVLTMPGCVLMLFSWGYGWNNSFTKGYELAPIGPGTGIAGLILFIAAMFYLPIAQAHQAATGNWKAFYQWRIVWRIGRHRWLAGLGLSLAYSLISVPVMWQRIQPYYWPQMRKLSGSDLAALSPQQVESQLAVHYLGAAVVVLGGFLLVRYFAARTYAGGLVRALRGNDIPPFALSPAQFSALELLGLLKPAPPLPVRPLRDFAGRVCSLMARLAAAFGYLAVWFTFAAQIYIAQFLNYVPVFGWLNQPLVQLPWIKYIPHKAAGEAWGLLFVSLIALVLIAIRSALRQLRAPTAAP